MKQLNGRTGKSPAPGRNVLWNVRVDVREGANNSVKLDQANVTGVN